MKTKADFSDEKNREIRQSCEMIRAGMSVRSAVKAFSGDNDVGTVAGQIAEKIKIDSPIDLMIKGNDWGNLFKDETWLNVLSGAQNLSHDHIKGFKKPIEIIQENFYEETTPKYLMPKFTV